MSHPRRSLIVIVLIVVWLAPLVAPPPVQSQMAVVDVAVVGQLVVSLQALLQLVGINLRDLQTLSNLGPILQMVQQVAVVAGKMQVIAGKIRARNGGWRQLVAQGQACASVEELDAWLYQAAAYGMAGADEAGQALELIEDSAQLVQSLIVLVGMINAFQGTTGGLQLVNSFLFDANAKLALMHTIVAPWQQVMLGETMIAQTAAIAMRRIRQSELARWGSY